MAGVTLQQLLHTSTVTRLVSRIKTPMSKIQNHWGMGPNGNAINSRGGKVFSWDIFDKTRKIAQGRPHGTGPANTPKNPTGQVTANAYRAHETIFLAEDQIFRTRPLGGQWGNVDSRGQTYVAAQAQYLGQRFRNNREFIISRMLRGQYQILLDGDNWIPVDTGGQMTVDFKIPAGNKGRLNMVGDGDIISASWAVNTTDILGNILSINAAFEQQHGYPLRHLWCNSQVYNAMLANDSLRNVAGTANTVFTQFEPTGLLNVEGIEDTGFNVVFRAIPWLQVHVYDAGLDVNGTFTKFFPDNYASFQPDPEPGIAEWLEGSEVVAENVMDPGREAYGMTSWTTRVIDPAGFELKTVDAGLPALYIPKTLAWGEVIF